MLLDTATPVLFLGLVFVAGAIIRLHRIHLAYAGLRSAFSDSLPHVAMERIARHGLTGEGCSAIEIPLPEGLVGSLEHALRLREKACRQTHQDH